jgi:hypothetical protein
MFTVEERERLRERLVARAEADGAVVGAAFTGSYAVGTGDRWSDTDLVLAVRGDLGAVVADWTGWLYGELGALHHWDLPVPAGTVRVFLLPGWLEADVTFAPEAEFGPRGPNWSLLFGTSQTIRPFRDPDPDTLTGLLWHHALHARVCLERGRLWQAEHWIAAMREHILTLACLRLGLPTAHAKGAHLLPDDVTGPLAATLVRTLTAPELQRSLRAALTAADAELARTDPVTAARLEPLLAELADLERPS